MVNENFIIGIIKPIKEGIDYAFKNHKNQILSKNRAKIDEYLFDINQTWNLNIELLKNYIESSKKFNPEQKENIIFNINNLKAIVEEKKNLKNEKQKLSGKILMDQQILQEFKRRNLENSAYFQEQMDEYKENLDKKNDFVKQYEKKFNEVQIYVHRQVKTQKNNNYNYLNDYEIINFINENENFNKKKNNLIEDIKIIKNNINNLTIENSELKKLNENNSTFFGNELANDNDKYSQLKNIILNYKKKIINIEKKNRQLKMKLDDLNNIVKYKENAYNENDKENIVQLEIIKESNLDKLNKNEKCDDVSMLKDINETNFNDLIANKTVDMINRELWDISCIEKKND